MNYAELKKKLKAGGCYKLDEGKRHERWYSPKTGETFSVGRHNGQEVASGTLSSIKKASGLDL